jgi:hypothetical protein
MKGYCEIQTMSYEYLQLTLKNIAYQIRLHLFTRNNIRLFRLSYSFLLLL